MNLRKIALVDLRDAPLNANRLAPEKYVQLVASIRRLGFLVPIIVRDDEEGGYEIVDGHHRAKAVREIGAETEIPAVVLEPGEDPQLAALALNRLRGETDLAVASLMIDEMLAGGLELADLAISGFTERELTDLVEALTQEEPSLEDVGAADLPEEVGTKVARPFLLELTFKNREDLGVARKALRKACGKTTSELAERMTHTIEAWFPLAYSISRTALEAAVNHTRGQEGDKYTHRSFFREGRYYPTLEDHLSSEVTFNKETRGMDVLAELKRLIQA